MCQLAATMILLDKVATKVHLTYDDGGENHKERVLVYIGVGTVGSQDLYFSNIIGTWRPSVHTYDSKVKWQEFEFLFCLLILIRNRIL